PSESDPGSPVDIRTLEGQLDGSGDQHPAGSRQPSNPLHDVADETREPERVSAWGGLEAFSQVVQRAHRRDRWEQQPRHVEVWSEKAPSGGRSVRYSISTK